MRNFAWIVFLIATGGWSTIQAQPAAITGKDPAYSGATIRISVPGNPFIIQPQFSETITFDQEGSFEFQFEPGSATMVRLETGIYQASLYIEPGDRYEIVLPVYHEKEYSQKISPFFQPLRVPLKIRAHSRSHSGLAMEGTPDINLGIFHFDSLYFPINDIVVHCRRTGLEMDVDSAIHLLEKEFENDTSLFFQEYRRYRYGILKLNEGKTGLEKISRKYLGPTVREEHPGFMELFRIMYKDFLFYFSRTPAGRGISEHINRTHQIDSIRSILGRHPSIWNDTMIDMVLLQELPEVFYSGTYHKDAILILLDSITTDPALASFSLYASQIRNRLSSLMVGHPPPQFTLPDLEGKAYSIDDSKGRYIYLMFCTPDHYGCMMEYPFLQSFHDKHTAYLDIVSVMIAREKSQVGDFMKRNGYSWKALFYGDLDGILTDFKVKAFPTAYLIDRNGNLLLSPATLPSDGFEQHLFRIMRSRGEI